MKTVPGITCAGGGRRQLALRRKLLFRSALQALVRAHRPRRGRWGGERAERFLDALCDVAVRCGPDVESYSYQRSCWTLLLRCRQAIVEAG